MVGKSFAKEIELSSRAYSEGKRLFRLSSLLGDDKKSLLKVIGKLATSARISMALILKLGHLKRKIRLSKSFKTNYNIFFKNFEELSGLDESRKKVLVDLLDADKFYGESGFEFSYGGKVIMLSNKGTFRELSEKEVANYVGVCGELLQSVSRNFLDKIRKV